MDEGRAGDHRHASLRALRDRRGGANAANSEAGGGKSAATVDWRPEFILAWLLTVSCLHSNLLAQTVAIPVAGAPPGGVLVGPDGLTTIVDQSLSVEPKRVLDNVYPVTRFVSLRRLGKVNARIVAEDGRSKRSHSSLNDHSSSESVDQVRTRRDLGGLQRIDHVLVYPRLGDIVLCGRGDVVANPTEEYPVGVSNRLPCLTVDDLRACWTLVSKLRALPFGCSIEPTPNGIRQMKLRALREPPPSTGELADALGPQRIDLIRLSGKYSMDHTIVAADIRLKRIALGVDDSRHFRLPRVQDLGQVLEGVIPRVWIGANYGPVRRSPDRRIWSMAGQLQVHLDFPVGLEPTSSERRRIEAWCREWTTAVNDPTFVQTIFHHLQGISDLAVTVALVQRYELLSQQKIAGFRWTRTTARQRTRPVPSATPSLCRIDTRPRRLVAGGVLLSPWEATTICEDQPQNLRLWQAGRPPADESISNW